MIKLTKEELSRIKPQNNLVLISPIEDRSKHQLTPEVELKLETELTETAFQYINVIHRVVAVPDKVKFGAGFSEWKTDMELKVGDTVVVSRMAIQFAQTNNDYIDCESVKYFYTKYSDIYCKVIDFTDYFTPLKEPKIIDTIFYPINGYILAEPTKETEGWGAYQKEVESQKSAIVKFVGKPNTEHVKRFKPESQSFYEPMDMPCEVGDTIFFKKYANIHLEEGIRQSLGGLIVIKAKDISHIKRGELVIG